MPSVVTTCQPPAAHSGLTSAEPIAPAMKLTAIRAVLTRLRPSETTAKSRAEMRTFSGKMAKCSSTIATMISGNECAEVGEGHGNQCHAPAGAGGGHRPAPVVQLAGVLGGDRSGQAEQAEHADGER